MVGVLWIILYLFIHLQGNSAQNCGWPGRPQYGQLKVKRQGFLLPAAPPPESHPVGDRVEYSCPTPGYRLYGSQVRECGQDGKWTNSVPFCGKDLVRGGVATQSSTAGNYEAENALDEDPTTCAWTDKEDRQRWFQVELNTPAHIRGVQLQLRKENLQAFTVFVMETVNSNKTVYKLCGHFNNSVPREPRRLTEKSAENLVHSGSPESNVGGSVRTVEVTCPENKDSYGDTVLIRDDRKNEQYFTICQLSVFSKDTENKECGDPELPFKSQYQVVKPGISIVACAKGFRLYRDGEKTMNETISCINGAWNSSQLTCQAVDCPVLTSPDRGSVQVQRDEDGRLSTAKFSCQAGHILWGAEQLVCDDGSWSSSVPLCKILNCGAPPYMPHATASLINGRTVWGDEATYYCNDGYIMIANVTSGEPVAQEETLAVCSETGDWDYKMNFTCVDAGQLTTAWGGSASLSINIIYCLLALLIALMVPLTLIHCWGKKCRHKKTTKMDENDSVPPSFIGNDFQNNTILLPDELDSRNFTGLGNPSPKIGVYNVKSGSVIHPATVNPNVLRSYSSASSFKPIQVNPPQPFSLPSWNHSTPTLEAEERARAITSRPIHINFDSSAEGAGLSSNEDVDLSDKPDVDESGYATLILKEEPYYEVPPSHRDSGVITNHYNLYDPVTERLEATNLAPPLESEELYANGDVVYQHNISNEALQQQLGFSEPTGTFATQPSSFSNQTVSYPNETGLNPAHIQYQDTSSSYPDLLQMVGQSGPSTPEIVKTRNQVETRNQQDIGQLYAKVDFEKKRSSSATSRPTSIESDPSPPPSSYSNLIQPDHQTEDTTSYTKSLIRKFNSMVDK